MARLVVKQLKAGRDFGRADPVCAQMANFVYLVGDADTGECLVVDPAWAVQDILDAAAKEDLKVVGALVTHYHPDHCGGSMFGFSVEGLPKLLELNPCPVHVHKAEARGIQAVTGLEASDLVQHDHKDVVKVGDISVELLHTPGHTPGSLCFRVRDDALVSGDTVFLQGCGRVDLPGGDSDEMYRTLNVRLRSLPGHLRVYPGHAYAGDSESLERVRATNPVLRVADLQQWRRFMGG